MIEEKIDNQPLSNEENAPKAEVTTEQSLIEIDGSVESSEKAKPLSPQAKKNKLKEMKAKKEAEYKAKQKEEKLRLKELRKLEKAQNGGKKLNFKLILPIIAFLLLGGAFAFIYFKKPDLLKKLIPGKHKENVVLVNSDSAVAPEANSLAAEEQAAEATDTKAEVTKETESVAEPQTIAQPEPQAVPEPVVKEKPAKKESSSSEPFVGKATKLNGPCWIVSFSSVQDEKVASKGVKKLVDKGFLGGYYWMPDVTPGAKQLFKVYSGPYTSEADARTKQREIVEFNNDAYVMKLNQ